MEEEFEMEKEELLNLSLSLVPHTNYNFGHVDKYKAIICDKFELGSTSDGSSDGGECTYDHQNEIIRLLEIRHQMVIQDHQGNRSNCGEVIHLLLKAAAAAAAMDDQPAAISNLMMVYERASLVGDSSQRLGAYYADGLTTRILRQARNPLYNTIMKEPSQGDKLMALTHMYRVSPMYQFCHFTANQSILEALERDNNSRLHVLDMDLAFGLQWPSLIQSLSEKATPENPVSVRITGLGSCLEELRETEARLVSFAKSFDNMEFDFQGLVPSSRIFEQSVFKESNDETLAVNLVLSSFSSLGCVRRLRPSIVTVVEREGGGRVEYYEAMFGSLEGSLPRESVERVCIERDHLGAEIKREIMLIRESNETSTSTRMEALEFEGIELSKRAVMQAKLLLRMRTHCCHPQYFRVVERDDTKAISLAWQDTLLITATAWTSVNLN